MQYHGNLKEQESHTAEEGLESFAGRSYRVRWDMEGGGGGRQDRAGKRATRGVGAVGIRESGESLGSRTMSALCPVTSGSLIWGIAGSPRMLVRQTGPWVSPPGNCESAGLEGLGSLVCEVGCSEGLSWREQLGSYCNRSGKSWWEPSRPRLWQRRCGGGS